MPQSRGRVLPLILILLASRAAWARAYDTYRADLPKGAFCAAIAGACASDDDPENGLFGNPAALASGKKADLIYDGDYNGSSNLEPGMKRSNEVSETVYMGGLAWASEDWGIGLAFTGRSDNVASQATLSDPGGQPQFVRLAETSRSLQVTLPAAYRISPGWSVGAALRVQFYSENIDTGGGMADGVRSSQSFPSLGFALGAIYRHSERLRFGSWIRSPLTYYGRLELNTVSFGNALSYTEDIALTSPFTWDTGVSFMPWQDARTFFFDVVVIGTTPAGYLLSYDGFSSAINGADLIPKGRSPVLEPRLGFRAPWSARSKGTYLLGSYLERSRTDGVSDRIHFTGGVAYRPFSWIELMGGIDVAKDFFQLLLTFR